MRESPVAFMAAVLALLAAAPVARAAEAAKPAPADTALTRFLGGLSDSTDRYFGTSAAPVDTAGLDSALAFGLAHPRDVRRRRAQPTWTVLPSFRFNRAEGPVYGGAVAFGHPEGAGRFGARAAWSVGQKRWLGGGSYQKTLAWRETAWSLYIRGGRRTSILDRERASQGSFSTLRALLLGSDTRHYFREDGFEVAVAARNALWRAGARYHDFLQSPLDVTATWNIFDQALDPLENRRAARGRVREVRLEGAARAPWFPLAVSLEHATAGDAIGSDFEYRRWRAAAAGEVALGRVAALVPQAVYGRLTGEAVPQAAFYMGGARTLRSVPGGELAGTGLAVARLDVIGRHDVLALLRIPHPAAFPLHLGAFAASGAVWGDDPLGGPTRPGTDWPRREAWLHEAGIQVMYRPGIPDANGFVRFNYAWPLGPDDRPGRWSVSYSRPIDVLDPPGP